MKFVFAFLMMVLTTSAFANDQQALSKLIASSYQAMIDEQAAGNYNSSVQVTYLFQTSAEESQTIPVLYNPGIEINVPSKMEDCSENSESMACSLAGALFNWYEMHLPAGQGQFQINLQLGMMEKEISFQIN